MSGFDFDSLRDSNAPASGARERAGVETRARQLRGRARRTRIAASVTSLVAVAAIVLGVVAITRPTDSTITVTEPSSSVAPTTTPVTSGAAAVGDRFVPPTHLDNGVVVLPVTFPNGETTTLRYPPAMKIAQLGFAGGVGVNYVVDEGALHCCSKQISITYATVADVYGNAKPVHVYDGPNGEPVYYFHSSQAVKTVMPPLDFLVFQFGPWLVQVYDVQHSGDNELRMTEAQRATWARSLTGTTDASGYLLLHTTAPLSLGNTFDGGFGDATGNTVELAAHEYCNQPESDTSVRRTFENEGGRGVSWCQGDLHVSATGGKAFVNLATSDLQATPLSSGVVTEPTTSTTTTTSTTLAPVAPLLSAWSASFISADEGWALGTHGAVEHTTDGGATWTAVGSLGAAGNGLHIRFANASRGFVFSTDPNFAAPFLTTDDGGAHWKSVDTPFSNISDLAVAHGVVYVVGTDPAAPVNPGGPEFHIWSAPVADLQWTRTFGVITIGGGSDPRQQLVFAGNRGWLVNVDRVVRAGARLDPTTGNWNAWDAICKGAGGPAYLAAATSEDLVASCGPGPASTSPKSFVDFSHDGGTTFTRHDAPGFGPVASPDPTTAVIATNSNLQRTTDGGITWKVVMKVGSNVTDIGFTTTTQGFVAFGDGQMFMTHDAGATWQRVTRA